jgi:hypothetical protein
LTYFLTACQTDRFDSVSVSEAPAMMAYKGTSRQGVRTMGFTGRMK